MDDKRAQMAERLADHVLKVGLGAASLRSLAAAAGTSDRMLLYYFADKDELIAATLAVVAARLTTMLDAAQSAPAPLEVVTQRLALQIADPALWPYQRLFLEIASLAANGDAGLRGLGERLGRGFLAWGAAQLIAENDAARARDAARLLVMCEGMVFLRAIGLEDVAHQAVE